MFNDLLEEFRYLGFDDFAFADDLAINGADEQRLIAAINVCKRWAIKNNMKINLDKSGIIMWTDKNKRKKEVEGERICGIPIVENTNT